MFLGVVVSGFLKRGYVTNYAINACGQTTYSVASAARFLAFCRLVDKKSPRRAHNGTCGGFASHSSTRREPMTSSTSAPVPGSPTHRELAWGLIGSFFQRKN